MGIQREIVEMDEYKRFVKNYRCNRCYGPLTARFICDRKVEITCTNTGCDGDGFVTLSHVERMKSQDIGDYREAKRNLASALGIEEKKSSIDELMRSIGL